MSNEVEELNDAFLDDLLGQMAEDTAPRAGGGGRSNTKLRWLQEGTFVFRPSNDLKGKLYRIVNFWSTDTEVMEAVKNEDGTPALNEDGSPKMKANRKKLRALVKEKDDEIYPVARELAKLYPESERYRLYSQWNTLMFGAIIDLGTTKKSDNWDVGPCVMICSGQKFLTSLRESFSTFTQSPEGRAALLQTLSPKGEGITFQITVKKGNQGSVIVNPLTFGKKHKFEDKDIEEMKDIMKVFFPTPGDQNDADYLEILKAYQRRLERKSKEKFSSPGELRNGLDAPPESEGGKSEKKVEALPASGPDVAMDASALLAGAMASAQQGG